MDTTEQELLPWYKQINKKKILFWGIAIFFVISFITGPYGLYQRVISAGQQRQLKAQIEQLQKEQQLLQQEREQLKSDLNYIEKTAREKYSMVREGEQVLKVIPKDKPVKE